MHTYRTQKCCALSASDVGQTVRLSGSICSKRYHRNLVFVDLRDPYCMTQIVIDTDNQIFVDLEKLRVESVITVTGDVIKRTPETINDRLPTGEIEIKVATIAVQSSAERRPSASIPARNAVHRDVSCVGK